MKKALAAAALCSVAARAASSEIRNDRLGLPFGGLSLRGGDDSSNSTSTPKSTSNKKKKRSERKSSMKSQDVHGEDNYNSIGADDSRDKPRKEQQSSTNALLESLILEQDYYTILGIKRTASDSQIKKAYRKRAVQTHPDKTNGDRRAFDKVSEAYEILSDETKRSVYDRYGKKGLEQLASGFPSGRGPEEIFRQFFGQQQFSPRNRTVRYQLEVSLEDLYQGLTQSILIEQPNGRKKVQVHVPKGTASGETVVLSGEMDEFPDATPGDLVFILQQRPHATFTRKGHDLAMELTISLNEAIGGVQREIVHLDGRRLVLRSARISQDTACWIQTGDVHVLKGEGMPKRDSIGEHGDLYVQFRVEMPKSTSVDRLTVEERAQLTSLLEKLEGTKQTTHSQEATVKVMQRSKLSDFGTASGPFRLHQDEHTHHGEDHGDFRRSFYWANTGPFGNPHSFFGRSRSTDGADDGSNVQCQQM